MRIAALALGLVLRSAELVADDHNIDFDSQTDFSKIKTFTIRPGRINSGRPELNNALVLKKIGDSIRAVLTSRGLKETADRPDVVVEFGASGLDYSVGPGGRASAIGASRGDDRGRGRGERGGERGVRDNQSSQHVDFSEGTLVIDLTAPAPGGLVWRGVYHDNEKNSTKLAKKFPDDAKKLLSAYPPKKKK